MYGAENWPKATTCVLGVRVAPAPRARRSLRHVRSSVRGEAGSVGVTGTEAVRKLRAVMALVRDRESVTDAELATMLGLSDSRSALSSKRAEAGRLGGQRSAEARLEATGSNRPKQTRSKPEATDEPKPEANLKQRFGFASAGASDLTSLLSSESSSLSQKEPKDNNNFHGLVRSPGGAVVVVVGGKTELKKPEQKTPRPRNLSEALGLPLLERAAMLWKLRDSSFDAEVFCAHQWDEIQDLAQAFRDATGMKHEKAGPWPDPRTKRLVELLATPHLPSELKAAFAALPRSSWWSNPEKRRYGLAGISPRVLAGVLTEADGPRGGRLSPQEIERLFEEPAEEKHATA